MANSSFRSPVLAGLLDELAIPYLSVVVSDINADPVGAHIDYKPEATQEQIDLGNATLAAFDWRKRRPLDRSTIVTAFQSLTTAQQNSVLRHIVCDVVRSNPALQSKINAALGLSLTVDEVDPT